MLTVSLFYVLMVGRKDNVLGNIPGWLQFIDPPETASCVLICYFFFFVMLGIELKVSKVLGKSSTTEPHTLSQVLGLEECTTMPGLTVIISHHLPRLVIHGIDLDGPSRTLTSGYCYLSA